MYLIKCIRYNVIYVIYLTIIYVRSYIWYLKYHVLISYIGHKVSYMLNLWRAILLFMKENVDILLIY